MAYDAESDLVVLFGGSDLYTAEVLADTWAYDYEANIWTNLQPWNSAPPHHFHDMVYHEAKDRIVLFGGFKLVDGTYVPLNDIWTFDANTNMWIELYPGAPPAPRAYHTLAYESGSEKIVMFGGILDETNWPYEPTIDETWVFDLDRVAWTQESPKKVASSRAWHQMVGIGKGVVLFGGGPSRFDYNSDTYTYSSRNNMWKRVNPCDEDDRPSRGRGRRFQRRPTSTWLRSMTPTIRSLSRWATGTEPHLPIPVLVYRYARVPGQTSPRTENAATAIIDKEDSP